MLFWHRKIWLGDGDKPGQSVYWDTKEKKAYIGESSKLISAKKSKNNGLYAGIGVVAIISIIEILKLFGVRIQPSEDDNSLFWIALLTFVYSAISIYLMNRFFYPRHVKYTETTLKQAKTTIKTHAFSGAKWKELLILEPGMMIFGGGLGVLTVIFVIGELVVSLKW